MLRIVIGIVIVALLLVALFLPRFRRALWATLVIVITLLAVIIWVDNRERKLDHSRLPPNQIELLNMQVRAGLNSRVICGERPSSEPFSRIYPTDFFASAQSQGL